MIAGVVARRPILRSVNNALMRVSKRNHGYMNNVVAPPRYRVSFAEKVAHGIAICFAGSIIPLWVSVHIKEYNKGNEPEE